MSTSEVNAVFRYGSNIFTAGAQDETLGVPAVLQSFPLTLNLLTAASDTNKVTKPLRSFAGTSLTVKGTTLYALSGDGSGTDTGGLTVFNANTLAEVSQTDIADARSIWYNPAGTSGANTNTPWVVAGKTATSNSKLYRLSDAGAIVQTIDMGVSANTIRESKSSVQVGSTLLLVSRGDQGFAIYCAKDGGLLAQQAAVTIAGVDPKLTVTNSVTPGPGLVFAANGEAGVYAYSMKDSGSAVGACRGITLASLGNVALGTTPVTGVNISANQVYYSGVSVLGVTTGTLYVAAGIAGLKIINLTQVTTVSDILDF